MMTNKSPDTNVVPLPTASRGDMTAICARMTEHHEEQLALCTLLEKLADELPDLSDTQLCLRVAKRIHPMICDAHAYEEKTLFPLLMSLDSADDNLKSTLERLRYEHWEDESFADEVSDGLAGFVTNKAAANAEALAYMLRGFFEGLRRHIAFEREHIIPILIRSRTKT